MDRYTKLILALIAISLIAIAIKLWEPAHSHNGFLDKGPTLGDLVNLRKLKGEALKKERERIFYNLPLVKVYGSVDVDVQNTVDVSGSIDCN